MWRVTGSAATRRDGSGSTEGRGAEGRSAGSGAGEEAAAVFPVVTKLLVAAACSFFDGLPHAVGDVVGIHDDTPVDVAGCTAGSLRKRTGGAEETFLVGIEDGYQ